MVDERVSSCLMMVLLAVQFHLVFGSGGRGAEETRGAEAIWT